MTNFHTHTTFCDGKNTAEEMVVAAIEKGFTALGFSSHSDMIVDFAAYTDEIARLKAKYADKIRIFCGLELELAKPRPDYLPTDSHYPLSYLIGSHHFISAPDGAFFAIDNTAEELLCGIRDHFGNSPEAFVRAYYAALRSTLGMKFDIVGHPDLIRKFNRRIPWLDESAAWYREELALTAEAIAASAKLVEVNTGAISRGWLDDAYPSAEFRELLRERGVRFILSSDAHSTEGLDCAFDRYASAERYLAFSPS